MPTVQQKVLIEKRMNKHWDRLAKQKAVLDNTWAANQNIGVGRREHHVLHDKKIESENLNLYRRLYHIEHEKRSKTAVMMDGSDPMWLAQLHKHRQWQRNRDIEEHDKRIGKQNMTLYRSIVGAKSKIQPREEMLKEYDYNHQKVDNYTKNKVKDVELHLNIRRFKDYDKVYNETHSPTRPKTSNCGSRDLTSPIAPAISPVKNNCSRKKISKPVLGKAAGQNHVITEGGRMPSRFRETVRPASAGATRKSKVPRNPPAGTRPLSELDFNLNFKSKKEIKAEIRRVYQLLAEQAAITVTSEDIDTYVSDHKYDHNVESDVFEYVYGGNESPAQWVEHPTNFNQEGIPRTLFDATEESGKEAAGGGSRPRSPYLEKVRNKYSPPKKPSPKKKAPSSPSTPSSARDDNEVHYPNRGVNRRYLFTETQLTACIRVSDRSGSDDCADLDVPENAVFVIRMFDVGQDCDLQILTPIPVTSDHNQSQTQQGEGLTGDSESRQGPESPGRNSNSVSDKVPTTPPPSSQKMSSPPPSSGAASLPMSPLAISKDSRKKSRPVLVPTSSGILLECRLQPETESTLVHDLFISMPDVKAMIRRCYAKKSKLWQAMKKVNCRNKERALYDCLTDLLDSSLQNQLCGLLSKKIELRVTLDPECSPDFELAERINVDFKFQL